jgi:hypothetical protein
MMSEKQKITFLRQLVDAERTKGTLLQCTLDQEERNDAMEECLRLSGASSAQQSTREKVEKAETVEKVENTQEGQLQVVAPFDSVPKLLYYLAVKTDPLSSPVPSAVAIDDHCADATTEGVHSASFLSAEPVKEVVGVVSSPQISPFHSVSKLLYYSTLRVAPHKVKKVQTAFSSSSSSSSAVVKPPPPTKKKSKTPTKKSRSHAHKPDRKLELITKRSAGGSMWSGGCGWVLLFCCFVFCAYMNVDLYLSI